MRDIIVTLIIFGSIPLILTRPYVGILMWSWIGYMNPHRLTWGFAYDMPFAQIVAVATIVALFFNKEPKRIPVTPITIVWGLFITWMIVTTVFAIYPEDAFEQLKKIFKIQLVTFLTMMVMTSKERINLLIWVIVASLGFYGVKGGLFTILTGGSSRVYGPPGGFIEDNNALALATLMTIPLMYYLRLQTTNRWIRMGLLAAIVLSAAAVLGSHSRGAFVAGVVVAAFFWVKSHNKVLTGFALILLVPSLLFIMPREWTDRIMTISEDSKASVEDIESMRGRGGVDRLSAPIPSRDWLGYWPNDFSALGRVNAWNYSINLANSRITGGGLESWSEATFAEYAPIVEEVQAAHSIYFSVLADHGWLGFLMYVSILLMAWRTARLVVRQCRDHEELKWMSDLARMIQISLVAYMIGGAFLSLSYFDLSWHLVALVVLCRTLAEQHLQRAKAGGLATSAASG